MTVKYSIGQIVYLKTDEDQSPRMVTGIHLRPGSAAYSLSYGTSESTHYEIEIMKCKDELTALGLLKSYKEDNN